MLRVGYPAIIAAEWFSVLPSGVELVPLSQDLDHDVEIDVWIPDPYPARSLRIAPHLRGVRLVLSLMAGTEWIPGAMGPHVTICNARGAHNVSTAEWAVSATFAMLKHFPVLLRCAALRRVEAPLRRHSRVHSRHRRHAPRSIRPSCLKS